MSDSESSSEEEFVGEEEEEQEEEEEEEEYNEEEEEAEDEDEEEDRKMPARRASREREAPPSYAEDDDDDDDDESSDDDDIPLASLVSKKKPPPAAAAKKKKAAPKKKKASNGNSTAAKKRKTSSSASKSKAAASSSSNNNKSYDSASAALYNTESLKGMLVQRLLCRWWYSVEWPDPTTIPAQPPDHYDSLDGFPGVFICTSSGGEADVGHLLDMRNKDEAPSFANFSRRPASELQELLLEALQKQLKELIASEGTGTSTEKELKDLIKWTQKVNTTKADKEAIKVLKAHGLSLP